MQRIELLEVYLKNFSLCFAGAAKRGTTVFLSVGLVLGDSELPASVSNDCPEEKHVSYMVNSSRFYTNRLTLALSCNGVPTFRSLLARQEVAEHFCGNESLSLHIMLPLLLVFSLLVRLADAASTNTTAESPTPDPTSSNYRSVWSILGTCALTLIICIWNVAYPNIMHEKRRYKVLLYPRQEVAEHFCGNESLSLHIMLPLLLVFSLLVRLADAASTNTTAESPTPDPTSSNYRSVWSILGTCALTLIICIWNVAYPNIMHEKRRYKVLLYRVALALSALLAPEFTSVRAYSEWKHAGKIKQDFRDKQWTRTHGFFALMGGFIIQDGAQQELFNTQYDLGHLRNWKFVNPKITEEQIRDRSKSDALGNAILVVQLSWFILQVIARAVNHVAITLVEIDTLALAALSLPLFFFWWSKPMAAACPHIFYKQTSSSVDDNKQNPSVEPDHTFSVSRSKTEWFSEIVLGGGDNSDENVVFVGLIVWMIFGALHTIAWDFQFPSQTEKTMWRVASLTLIGAPSIFFLAFFLDKIEAVKLPGTLMNVIAGATLCIGVVARLLLVLMLASLRDLPPSAHDTVSWTVYVPHL
ncbi:hypothetical protein PAXINDRAFT_100365 [Paxillus involutus ATCC 200175]|uniref:Uncharacterized protein n=1 Tax=Paxillus involutus ATCC 200175 TaxID=664439 RepID=A0A0C9TEI9_PAXIN|nr:hypothetical protein PAXINDRAFT_100365 [Paxillus involutus ATCC 200175]